jgi:hypothetical protein
MDGGPFKIDPDYESILNPADWKELPAISWLGAAK